MNKIIITGPERVGKSRLCRKIVGNSEHITLMPFTGKWISEIIDLIQQNTYDYFILEDVSYCKNVDYAEFFHRLKEHPTKNEFTLIIVSIDLPTCKELLDGALIISLKRNTVL